MHYLRHTHASFGAAGGLGLPVIGKLLGHKQAATRQRSTAARFGIDRGKDRRSDGGGLRGTRWKPSSPAPEAGHGVIMGMPLSRHSNGVGILGSKGVQQ